METWPPKFSLPSQTKSNTCVVTFPSRQIYYTSVSVSLFFLPMIIMIATYCMIVWRLWVTEMPGERSDAALSTQSRAKRKVSSKSRSPFSPLFFFIEVQKYIVHCKCLTGETLQILSMQKYIS